MTTHPYGFRVVGSARTERRLVDWQAAFVAHCAADPKSEPDREGYLSAFTFGDDFQDHMTRERSPKGFDGDCSAPWVWMDIDRPDLKAALADARKLVGGILQRFTAQDDDDVLTFFSGAKGFHVGFPSSACRPKPSAGFNRVARSFCDRLAAHAGVTIDTTVYDKQRLFRAPNSRHPKSGLFKGRVTHDELTGLSAVRLVDFFNAPRPFDSPTPKAKSNTAVDLWAECEAQVTSRTPGGADSPPRTSTPGTTLQRSHTRPSTPN